MLPNHAAVSARRFYCAPRPPVLFLYEYPWRRSKTSIPLGEHLTLWASKSAACISAKVISQSCSISSTKKTTNGSSLPLPLRAPQRPGSRLSPLRYLRPQRAAVARLSRKTQPAAAAVIPSDIKDQKRLRRSIDKLAGIKSSSQNKGIRNINKRKSRF